MAQCRYCGKRFHACSNCCFLYQWEYEFCRPRCRNAFYGAEIQQVVNRLKAGEDKADVELELGEDEWMVEEAVAYLGRTVKGTTMSVSVSTLRDCLQSLIDNGVPPDAPVVQVIEGGRVAMPIEGVDTCGVRATGDVHPAGESVVCVETPAMIRSDYWAKWAKDHGE